MARPRIRPGRILAVLVLFVLLCLLLELNRLLPGGWPGGGGDGGLRRVGQLDLDDVPGTPDAAQPEPARMKEAGERPPVTIPREGVVIEVRLPDGSWLDTWRFGVGEDGREDEAREGRHTSRDRRLSEDGFRVRAGGGLVRILPSVANAEPGHWIVVAPEAPPHARRKQTRLDMLLESTWGHSKVVRVEKPDGSSEDVRVDDQGKAELKTGRGPMRVTAVVDGVAGAPRWVGPRTQGAVALEAPAEPEADADAERARIVLLPKGAMHFAARFPRPVGGGEAEPAFGLALPEGEEGTGRSLRVPKGVPVDVLVDDPAQQPYSVRVPAGTATRDLDYEVRSGQAISFEVRDPQGKPVDGAFVVAGVAADPFLALRHATTDAEGKATLRGIPRGSLGVFVAAPAKGLATQRVLLDVKGGATHRVRLERGQPLRVVICDTEGLPIPGATIDIEPKEGRTPVPSAPRPTAGALPDVGADVIAALGWNDSETDARGGWRAEGLPAGTYRLRVRAKGYARLTVADVVPAAQRTYFITMIDAE